MVIPYTADHRISGAFLLKNIIGEELIMPGEDGLVFENGRHAIRDLVFSEDLRSESGMTEELRHLTENVVRLFYFVEEDPSFHIPAEEIGVPLRPYFQYRDVTGMSLLSLFSLPFLKVLRIRDRYIVKADSLILNNLPDAEKLLSDMVEKCLAFSHETASSVEVGEDMEEDVVTLSLLPGMELTSFGPPEEDPDKSREKRVRKNFETEMARLNDMFDSLKSASDSAERLRGYLEDDWQEVTLPGIVCSLPEAFSLIKRDEDKIVYQVPGTEDTVCFPAFLSRETLSRRYLKTEEMKDQTRVIHLSVQTAGGVQPLKIRLGCPSEETGYSIEQITERIIRSMRWLQR